jgi:hypothetical protein
MARTLPKDFNPLIAPDLEDSPTCKNSIGALRTRARPGAHLFDER